MRQGQPNKRLRGRNRKGPNLLTRSYESNGPDVKIRGTALHIADKYVSLARDAQASGDTITAESYLQHAEHYYRVIAAAQAQMGQTPSFNRSDEADHEEDTAAYTNGGGNRPPAAAEPQNPPASNGAQPGGAMGEAGDMNGSVAAPGAPQPDVGDAQPISEADGGRAGGEQAGEGEAKPRRRRRPRPRIDASAQPEAGAVATDATAEGERAASNPGEDDAPSPAPRRRRRTTKAANGDAASAPPAADSAHGAEAGNGAAAPSGGAGVVAAETAGGEADQGPASAAMGED